jgi:hypothetical protein
MEDVLHKAWPRIAILVCKLLAVASLFLKCGHREHIWQCSKNSDLPVMLSKIDAEPSNVSLANGTIEFTKSCSKSEEKMPTYSATDMGHLCSSMVPNKNIANFF